MCVCTHASEENEGVCLCLSGEKVRACASVGACLKQYEGEVHECVSVGREYFSAPISALCELSDSRLDSGRIFFQNFIFLVAGLKPGRSTSL